MRMRARGNQHNARCRRVRLAERAGALHRDAPKRIVRKRLGERFERAPRAILGKRARRANSSDDVRFVLHDRAVRIGSERIRRIAQDVRARIDSHERGFALHGNRDRPFQAIDPHAHALLARERTVTGVAGEGRRCIGDDAHDDIETEGVVALVDRLLLRYRHDCRAFARIVAIGIRQHGVARGEDPAIEEFA